MGKGDKKSKKGKIAKGSYGNSRKRNAIKFKLKRTAAKKSSEGVAAPETPVKARRVVKKKTEA